MANKPQLNNKAPSIRLVTEQNIQQPNPIQIPAKIEPKIISIVLLNKLFFDLKNHAKGELYHVCPIHNDRLLSNQLYLK